MEIIQKNEIRTKNEVYELHLKGDVYVCYNGKKYFPSKYVTTLNPSEVLRKGKNYKVREMKFIFPENEKGEMIVSLEGKYGLFPLESLNIVV